MSHHQARRERREAERKAKKAEIKRLKAEAAAAPLPERHEAALLSEPKTRLDEAALLSEPKTQTRAFLAQNESYREARAEISQALASFRAATNRANAQHSTGPRTPAGKLASSRNSLKHGLASGELIIPGEDLADFEALHHALFEEHQPANETESLLIKEIAQSFWLTQRAIRLQNSCFTEEGVEDERTGRSVPVVRVDERRLALFLRYHTTHDRALYKALNTLSRLQKERRRLDEAAVLSEPKTQKVEPGFVSQNRISSASACGFVSQNSLEPSEETRFVSQTTATHTPEDETAPSSEPKTLTKAA